MRSFTRLEHKDETNAIASTHCRHSYLAAFTPSRGLEFPTSSCNYPIAALYDRNLQREETLNARQKTRSLKKGYMRPRSTMQFLTTNVETTEHGLSIESGDDGSIAQAKNTVDVELQQAFVVDGTGKMFHATDSDADANLDLKPIEADEALKLFMAVNKLNKPKPPAGLDKTAANSGMLGMGWSQYGYYSSRGPSNAYSSLIEQQIGRQASKLPNFFTKPRPNTYLIVSEKAPPYVHLGTQADQLAGFHVTMGEW